MSPPSSSVCDSSPTSGEYSYRRSIRDTRTGRITSTWYSFDRADPAFTM